MHDEQFETLSQLATLSISAIVLLVGLTAYVLVWRESELDIARKTYTESELERFHRVAELSLIIAMGFSILALLSSLLSASSCRVVQRTNKYSSASTSNTWKYILPIALLTLLSINNATFPISTASDPSIVVLIGIVISLSTAIFTLGSTIYNVYGHS